MSKTRVILHGCNGAMGQVVSSTAAKQEDVVIVAGLDVADTGHCAYPVYTNPADCQEEADVIVDFSVAKALDGLLSFALARKLPVVICTTGFSAEQLAKIEETSKQIPVLRSANMSLGVNTVFKLAAAAAQVLAKEGYDMEIVEKHHNKKADAPSGTALAIADAMNEVLNQEYTYNKDRCASHERRKPNEIGIASVRGGTIVGEHEVLFCGPDEVVEIKHTAYSKAIFAKGALSAAAYLKEQKPGLYSMADVIG